MKGNGSPDHTALALFALSLSWLLAAAPACAPAMNSTEAHAKEILDHVEQTRLFIDNFSRQGSHPCAEEKCVFVTFWDFDGTIIDGDITDGYTGSNASGKAVQNYKGLQQLAIEAGLSARYPGTDAFVRYRADYERLEESAGFEQAYAYIAQIFAGARPDEFAAVVETHFSEQLAPFYFTASIDMLRRLQHNGVQTRVVSASPDFFVKGAAQTLGIPAEWIDGVRLETERVDGQEFLSDRIAEPFTYAAGKTARMRQIVAEIKAAENTDRVYVLAGFGNSWHTDGDFLRWVASQELPAGAPLAVLINGDVEAPTGKTWRAVRQSEIMRDRP